VASSGTPTRIRSSLGTTELIDYFAPNLFSAMQVERGKPAPDLFLFAAAQMNTPPARCLVIEDSVPGVTGARAAGMAVIGFTGGSHCRPGDADRLRAAGATIVIDDMRDLPALTAQTLNRDEITVI
jgi:beta-phosphoglucomutase-like phosphatase (HAD superfamily)